MSLPNISRSGCGVCICACRTSPVSSAASGQGYLDWKAANFELEKGALTELAKRGQEPRALVITSCDSRINVHSLFGVEHAELFIPRNIANLVHPRSTTEKEGETGAAIEYAVCAPRVPHKIVLGHLNCDGVLCCIEVCTGRASRWSKMSVVSKWLEILLPHYEHVAHIENPIDQAHQLEKATVIASLEKLTTYPFVAKANDSGELQLHGLWFDISNGGLECYDQNTGIFHSIGN